METEEKKKMSGWGKLFLFIGIIVLLWALPYIIVFVGMTYNMYSNNAGEVRRLMRNAVPRLRADMQANPERFDEAAEVITALRERTREMGIESFSIRRADEYDLYHPDEFARDTRGDYTLEEDDLQMTMYDDDINRRYWYLSIKNHPGLAPHEKYYMTEEQKAFLLEFFEVMDQHSMDYLSSDGYISLADAGWTYLSLEYIPTREEKLAFEERNASAPYCEAILPDWYAYIWTMLPG